MNIIDRSAVKLARSIRKHHPEAASEQALTYSLIMTINTVSAAVVSLLICALTGHLKEVLLVMLFYSLVRYFGGGAHLSSSLSCNILTIMILSGLAHVQFDYLYLGVIFDIVSITVFLLLAPQGIENVSRVDSKYYPLLKIICILIIASNFYFQLPYISAAFLLQSFFITPFSYKLIEILERRGNFNETQSS